MTEKTSLENESPPSCLGAVSGSFFPFAIYEKELKKITQIPQTQASLMIQLSILKDFANRLGLYDAADFLKNDR